MTVVDNVIKFKPKSMTTVSIEESDESWALDLLSENDLDEQHIQVQENNLEKINHYQNAVKHDLKKTQTVHSSDQLEDFNADDSTIFDASMLALTAIEIQKLALAEKEAGLMNERETARFTSAYILERIKAFLNYDLLAFMK